MTIALDYDGTWTADPELWHDFTRKAIDRGHTVIIVTGRTYRHEDLLQQRLPKWIPIVYAGTRLKEKAAQASGYNVDIWIDDNPGMIQECKILGGDDR